MAIYSVREVKEMVEQEGLEYAVNRHLSSKQIKNSHLANLWAQAEDALYEIENFLKHHEEE
jgi:arsenate reductase-like glutaredoxin family protein